MSLIDDALKQAQAAHDAAPGQKSHPRPWTPAPLPDPRRSKLIGRRGLVGAALAAGAIVAAFLLWRGGRPSSGRESSVIGQRPSSTGSVLAPITSEVVVEPPPRGLPSSRKGPARRAETPASHASVATSAPRLFEQHPGIATPPAGENPETRPRAARDARVYSGEVTLPSGGKITLDGIVISEANAVAVINGRVLPVGGYVEGFTIAKILRDRVELEAEGVKVVITLR